MGTDRKTIKNFSGLRRELVGDKDQKGLRGLRGLRGRKGQRGQRVEMV